jgi:hypothetical protein
MDEPEEDAERGRLPGSVGPEKSGDVPVGDTKAEAVDRGCPAVALAEARDLDHAPDPRA